MDDQFIEIDNQIKQIRHKMFETNVASQLELDSNDRQRKKEEYKELKHELATLLYKKYELQAKGRIK